MVEQRKLTPEDRLTSPVLKRYVRRLLHDSDQQYQSWKRNDAGRAVLNQENSNAGR